MSGVWRAKPAIATALFEALASIGALFANRLSFSPRMMIIAACCLTFENSSGREAASRRMGRWLPS
jgi:hypothetical protein